MARCTRDRRYQRPRSAPVAEPGNPAGRGGQAPQGDADPHRREERHRDPPHAGSHQRAPPSDRRHPGGELLGRRARLPVRQALQGRPRAWAPRRPCPPDYRGGAAWSLAGSLWSVPMIRTPTTRSRAPSSREISSVLSHPLTPWTPGTAPAISDRAFAATRVPSAGSHRSPFAHPRGPLAAPRRRTPPAGASPEASPGSRPPG